MKKILFITHYDNLYGANRALLTLVKKLKSEGRYEPMVVIPAKGLFTDELDAIKVPYLVCSITQWMAIYREPVSFAIKRRKRLKAIEDELKIMEERFKDENIALIHSNSSVIPHGAFLAKRLGCRHVWHVREFPKEHYGMRPFLKEEQVRKAFNAADRLIAISDAVKENLQEKYPAAKVMRIYDGIDTCVNDQTDHNDHDGVTFLYTAYLFPAKHQMDVCMAASELKKEGIADFKVIFAGDGDKHYRKKIEDFIAAQGLDKNVMIKGFVEDMDSLLNEADAGIIASEYEGFGLATVEYMRTGLPVIGRRSGATPEIVKDEETGLLYDDIQGLVKCMKKLISDAALRERMGMEGKERVKEFFTSDINAEKILSMYDGIF